MLYPFVRVLLPDMIVLMLFALAVQTVKGVEVAVVTLSVLLPFCM